MYQVKNFVHSVVNPIYTNIPVVTWEIKKICQQNHNIKNPSTGITDTSLSVIQDESCCISLIAIGCG